MPTAEAVAFFPLATAAASVAVWHTLAGPDHYLPLIAIGKARRWSLRRAMGITMLCGVAHCLASLVIVAAVLATLCAVGSTASLQVWRSDVAGMFAEGDAAAFSVEVEESIVVRVAYFATDEVRATEMGEKLKSRIGQAKLVAKTGGPDFVEALNAVETSHTGPVVSITANLSREVAERVLKALNPAE